MRAYNICLFNSRDHSSVIRPSPLRQMRALNKLMPHNAILIVTNVTCFRQTHLKTVTYSVYYLFQTHIATSPLERRERTNLGLDANQPPWQVEKSPGNVQKSVTKSLEGDVIVARPEG